MNARLQQILSELFKTPAESVTPDSGPHSIPAWDSAGHMNLVLALEKEFGVKFDEDEVVEMVSVEEIEAALRRHGASL